MAFLKILKGFFETKFFRKVKERKGNEIYVFLALLCKYEIDNDKMHARFVIFFFLENFEFSGNFKTLEDWNDFAKNFIFSEIEEVMFLHEWIFRQNMKNFKWTPQEDGLLKQIIDDFKYFFGKKYVFKVFF